MVLSFITLLAKNEKMRQTSLDAYEEIKTKGKIGERQRLVYQTLLDAGTLTDLEIAYATGLPINCVTPRRGELVKLGIVEFAGYDYGKRKRCLWRIKS